MLVILAAAADRPTTLADLVEAQDRLAVLRAGRRAAGGIGFDSGVRAVAEAHRRLARLRTALGPAVESGRALECAIGAAKASA